MTRNILPLYYAGTALFVALDYGFGINVRVAFLEGTPGLKVGYYLILFACFGAMLWRPALSTLIGIVESLATLIALILNMGLRTMVVTDAMIESGLGIITMAEVINFLISGGAAYFSYTSGVRRLFGKNPPL